MNDQNLMENLLNLEKGACDLYLHGTVESATPEVQQYFKNALNRSLNAGKYLLFPNVSKRAESTILIVSNEQNTTKERRCQVINQLMVRFT